MATPELPFVGIVELAAAYRERKVSPVEVTRALLERIDRLDPALHSFLCVTPEAALEDARTAEAEIARGAWRNVTREAISG